MADLKAISGQRDIMVGYLRTVSSCERGAAVLKHEEMLITYVIMSMKKLRAFDRPSAISCNTSAKLEHECRIVTQVQIANFSKTTNFTCPTGS